MYSQEVEQNRLGVEQTLQVVLHLEAVVQSPAVAVHLGVVSNSGQVQSTLSNLAWTLLQQSRDNHPRFLGLAPTEALFAQGFDQTIALIWQEPRLKVPLYLELVVGLSAFEELKRPTSMLLRQLLPTLVSVFATLKAT
jgi:hypothetical protein